MLRNIDLQNNKGREISLLNEVLSLNAQEFTFSTFRAVC